MPSFRFPLFVKFSLGSCLALLPPALFLALGDPAAVDDTLNAYLRAAENSYALPVARFLGEGYQRSGDWSFVPVTPPQFHDWLNVNVVPAGGPPGAPPPGQPGFGGRQRNQTPYNLDRRIVLLDAHERLVVGPPGSELGHGRWPIYLPISGGPVVGYVSFADADLAPQQVASQLVEGRRRLLGIAFLLALPGALLAGWLAARHILRPVEALRLAATGLAGGDKSATLPETRRDELSSLAKSFNLLAGAMRRNDHERRQFVADSSHELRTPIAVLRAQIEALQDGIHQADSGTLSVLHHDVMALSRLVDDLYALARADVGALKTESAPIDVVAIIEDVVESFAPRLAAAILSIEIFGKPETPWISQGDQRRLRQLFINLIENSTRYTDIGGRIEIRVIPKPNTIVIRVEDSAPGVPEEELDKLFDRFYRVESSRNRDQGGSGLGLAICRGIVEAHGGQIAASPSPLGGLRVEIVLPRGEVK